MSSPKSSSAISTASTYVIGDETDLSEALKQIYLDGEFTDITIDVNETECLLAHRAIIYRRCPQFRTLMRANKTGKILNLKNKNFKRDAFHGFLIYVYSGKLPNEYLNLPTCYELYVIGKFFNSKVVNLCCTAMVKQVTPLNVYEMMQFATSNDDNKLVGKIEQSLVDVLPSATDNAKSL